MSSGGTKIGEAYVEISAKLDKMEAGLKKAREDFAKTSGQMQKDSVSLSDKITATSKKIGSAFTIMSVAAAAGYVAFNKLIVKTAEHMDRLDEMSKSTGMAVESLSAMELAAKKSGVSLEGVGNAFKFLYKNIDAANTSGGEAKELFDRLKISFKESNGEAKTGEKLFVEVAQALDKIENPGTRAALTVKAFGRAGMDLIPMFGDLAKNMETAKRLGMVITKEQAEEAAEFADAIDEINLALRGLKEHLLTGGVLDGLTILMNLFTGGGVSEGMKSRFLASGIKERGEEIASLTADVTKYIDLYHNAVARGDEMDADLFTKLISEAQDTILVKEDELATLQKVLDRKKKELEGDKTGGGSSAPPDYNKMAAFMGVPRGSTVFPTDMPRDFAKQTAPEIMGAFRDIQKSSLNLGLTWEKELFGAWSIGFDQFMEDAGHMQDYFGGMMSGIRSEWASTIQDFIDGGMKFDEFMAQMFENVLSNFLQMISQMAAQQMAQTLFGAVFGGIGRGVSMPGITVPAGGGGLARAGTTVVNINAVDSQSFADTMRRNPDAIMAVVNESARYGRAS